MTVSAIDLHDIVGPFLTDVQHEFEVLKHDFMQDGASKSTLLYIEREIPRLDVMRWLSVQQSDVQFYWKSRDLDDCVACVGVSWDCFELDTATDPLDELRKCAGFDSSIRLYGGQAFSGQQMGPEWADFHRNYFFLPQVEIRQDLMTTRLRLNVLIPGIEELSLVFEGIRKTLETLSWCFDDWPETLPGLKRVDDVPEKHRWLNKVQALGSQFSRGLQKVVFARQKVLHFSSSEHPLTILHRAFPNADNMFLYFFQVRPTLAFMGGSPELLLRRQASHIETEALAGSRSRGQDAESDVKIVSALRSDPKELDEHGYVSQMISSVLAQYCVDIEQDESDDVLQLPYIQHLRTAFRATLRTPLSVWSLLQSLHPTPAVAGYPTLDANRIISEDTDFKRGWYTGYVGTFSDQSVETCVALRCALWTPTSLTCFAGAGLVAASHPQYEWQELQQKLQPFTSLWDL